MLNMTKICLLYKIFWLRDFVGGFFIITIIIIAHW